MLDRASDGHNSILRVDLYFQNRKYYVVFCYKYFENPIGNPTLL